MLQRFLKLGVIALMAWVPLCAAAQTIYKCKSVNGGMVYQSFPCAGAIAAEKQWSGSYRQPTNEELWQRYHTDQRWAQRQQAEHARRNAYRYSYRYSYRQPKQLRTGLCCITQRVQPGAGRLQAESQHQFATQTGSRHPPVLRGTPVVCLSSSNGIFYIICIMRN